MKRRRQDTCFAYRLQTKHTMFGSLDPPHRGECNIQLRVSVLGFSYATISINTTMTVPSVGLHIELWQHHAKSRALTMMTSKTQIAGVAIEVRYGMLKHIGDTSPCLGSGRPDS